MTRLPLFPLGVVLLPGLPLPLHIFEKRYRELVTYCLRSESEFGVVYYNGEEIQRRGCTAGITQVLRSSEDGKLDIMAAGIRRFMVREIHEERTYLEADVDFFDDAEEEADDEVRLLAREGIERLKRLASYTHTQQDLGFLEQLELKSLSFLLAGSSGFTMKERQHFLEMISLKERLVKSGKALDRLIDRAEIAKSIGRIIGGNGNINR